MCDWRIRCLFSKYMFILHFIVNKHFRFSRIFSLVGMTPTWWIILSMVILALFFGFVICVYRQVKNVFFPSYSLPQHFKEVCCFESCTIKMSPQEILFSDCTTKGKSHLMQEINAQISRSLLFSLVADGEA